MRAIDALRVVIGARVRRTRTCRDGMTGCIQFKTPEQIELMRAAGLVVAARAGARCARPSRPGSRTAELDAIAERVHPVEPARSRRSWATTASRRRSAPRSTSQVVHGIPTPSAGAARRRPDLDRLRRDPRRLARRRGDHGRRSARSTPSCWQLAEVAERLAVGRASRRGRVGRRPAHRHLARGRGRRSAPARPLRHRRRLRRPRHRHRDAPGPARAQLRPARPGPAAGARAGAGDRADDHAGLAATRSSSPTAGPSSPATARSPRTSSTPSRSPRTAPGCSPPTTAACAGLGELGVEAWRSAACATASRPRPGRLAAGRRRRPRAGRRRSSTRPFAEGRLDVGEFDERLAAAYAAQDARRSGAADRRPAGGRDRSAAPVAAPARRRGPRRRCRPVAPGARRCAGRR